MSVQSRGIIGLSAKPELETDGTDNLVRTKPSMTMSESDATSNFHKFDRDNNYTNIPSDDVLKMLHPDTLTSVDAFFNTIPYAMVDTPEQALKLLPKGVLYYLNKAELAQATEDYFSKIASIQRKIQEIKRRKLKRLLFRLALVMCCMWAITAGWKLGFYDFDYAVFVFSVQVVLSIIYTIWG